MAQAERDALTPESAVAAGVIRSSGLAAVGFVWQCGICDEGGNARYSDGAHANLVNHISRDHITWVQGLGAGETDVTEIDASASERGRK